MTDNGAMSFTEGSEEQFLHANANQFGEYDVPSDPHKTASYKSVPKEGSVMKQSINQMKEESRLAWLEDAYVKQAALLQKKDIEIKQLKEALKEATESLNYITEGQSKSENLSYGIMFVEQWRIIIDKASKLLTK